MLQFIIIHLKTKALKTKASICMVLAEFLGRLIPYKWLTSIQVFVVSSFAWPQGYKTFFKLSSAEHEISTAHKC